MQNDLMLPVLPGRKEYDLTKCEKAKVHYFSVNPNGEAELVRIILSPNCSARHKEFDFDFQTLEIKARASLVIR